MMTRKRPSVERPAVVQPLNQKIRLIPLTQGFNAIVDAADYNFLMKRNWHVSTTDGKTFYAYTNMTVDGKRQRISMHRLLCGCITNDGVEVDHSDHNGLNNRRQNLRTGNHRMNTENRRLYSNNTTGFIGVSLVRKTGLYRAQMNHCGHTYTKTGFLTAEAAAWQYDEWVIRLRGKFAYLNFPRKRA